MEYPRELIERTGGAQAFAAAASEHPDAPRRLTRDAVYMWQSRGSVPYAWRMVVRDMMQEAPE